MCLFQFCMTEVGFQPRLLAHGFGDANTGTTQFPTELWSSLLSTDYDGETNVRMAFKLRGNRVVAALGFGLAIPADIELDGSGAGLRAGRRFVSHPSPVEQPGAG